MWSKPFFIVFPFVVAALLGACSVENAHTVNVSREVPTQIGKNDRIAVVLASYINDSPREGNDLLAALPDPANRSELEALGLRFIVVLEVETRDENEKWAVPANAGGFAVGREWQRRSLFRAMVLDIQQRKRAGSIDVSNAQHRAGSALPGSSPSPSLPSARWNPRVAGRSDSRWRTSSTGSPDFQEGSRRGLRAINCLVA